MLPRILLVLVGPTASGKTQVGLELARLLDGEIISADSRQVYRFLDIGTAKPTTAQLRAVPHHCIDIVDPPQDFAAGAFGELGRLTVEEIFSRGKLPIVVGGSGLYVQALIDGLFEGPGADPAYRALLEKRLHEEGIEALLHDLRKVDPESASRVDPANPRRIMRALEVFFQTGVPLSVHQREKSLQITFSSHLYGLQWDRAELYRRIDARCIALLDEGLLEEVDALAARGWTPSLNALNTVGYREAFAYRQGEIDRAEMVRLFQRNSRRYAKRQMTWFRRDTRISWVQMAGREFHEVAQSIAEDFSRILGNPSPA